MLDKGLKVGLYNPTILGGKSYLSWFYDRGAIKDRAHIAVVYPGIFKIGGSFFMIFGGDSGAENFTLKKS